MDRLKSRLAPALIVAGVLALPVLYAAGYLLLGEGLDDPYADPFSVGAADRDRVFSARWQALAFTPAAIVEAKMTGRSVSLYTIHAEILGGRVAYSLTETRRIDP